MEIGKVVEIGDRKPATPPLSSVRSDRRATATTGAPPTPPDAAAAPSKPARLEDVFIDGAS